MTIEERVEEVKEEFSMLPEAEDKYTHIIDLGKTLGGYPEELRDEAYKVKGCQSNVWLTASLDGDKVAYLGDSDALIVKGLVGLMLRVYSGQPPQAVAQANTQWLEDIGLAHLLSPTRRNGLSAMLKQIRLYAVALSTRVDQN